MSVVVPVDFRCPICSGMAVELPDNYSDSSAVTCNACRAAIGVWGDVKQLQGSLLTDKASQQLKEALAAIPDWDVKP